MKTVKEISDLTGISVRTLHYYDEIGLLHPTNKSDAGYRLYDDKALETLQQILFFREFDIPLKEIKAIICNPTLDRNKILQMQRKMLVVKKERMEHLISVIDNIIKGENNMDFTIFTKTEIEELCQTTLDHMPDIMKESIIQEFGGIEQWQKHYVERCSKEDMQKGYQKMVEWYGDKDSALKAMNNPPSKEVGEAFAKRVEIIEKKLSDKKKYPLDSFEVKQIIGEYGFVMKQFSQVKHEAGIMLSIATSYRDERAKAILNEKYGEGSAEFFACAIEAFYKNE
ncbi:MerR family transcriptional regulator [Clostridium cadaveris]|uniref:DNA-binding transcriptional regulator, MerR family n=1 Tax=Clostridium cadaveris TaxID=1529 RepID=A0A1I2K7X8_9CLOT|nr:MerR family transcriptional regulator [Clostridium cadaveris]MDM8310922.1 MerR family transcriptional regulator [Clostridium cadaveris]NME63414.1 MerR family transcriptional regulator [Clostridium cadaveris]NWK12435.1 MerR family transcriptional regulator [Clostridium cadaveris]SFF62563.1 DNA-binding transcriptional regulator, MerR family [Clostridium cadaveris]